MSNESLQEEQTEGPIHFTQHGSGRKMEGESEVERGGKGWGGERRIPHEHANANVHSWGENNDVGSEMASGTYYEE